MQAFESATRQIKLENSPKSGIKTASFRDVNGYASRLFQG
jgi:hypothetical protein